MNLLLLAASLAMFPAASEAAAADPLDDLVAAIGVFRGIGADDISAYRVIVQIPEDGDEELAPLEETWQEPARLALRAADAGTPVAIVRGLALFLEPLYVTRTSLFSVDLEAGVAGAREQIGVAERPDGTNRVVDLTFPETPSDELPELLHDLVSLTGTLDSRGRLVALRIELRSGRERQTMSMTCRWEAEEPQPRFATWTLPNGDPVEIVTEFRRQDSRIVPASRRVTFPSRYDPGESEEILVEYGEYRFDSEIAETFWTSRGTFRFDANGLVTD